MMRAVLAVSGCCLMLTGCAAVAPSEACVEGTAFNVSPATATVNHSTAAPGNQTHFVSSVSPTVSGTGCAVPAWVALGTPMWTNPDPLDISISSAQDETNGTAVCNSATSGAVTLTANETFSGKTYTSTVALTCQ